MANPSDHVLEKLFSDGVITRETHERAVQHANQNKEFIEESLIDIGALDEDTLLKHLAVIYRTRYVSTEKIKRAEIPSVVLGMIPFELATKRTIFPILYDKKIGELSIVAVNPLDHVMEKEVSEASGAPRIRSFVSRPAAIKAAISKFYRGDIHAFSNIDKSGKQEFHNMMDVYERQLLDEEALVVSLANVPGRSERMISPADMERGAARADKPARAEGGANIGATLEMLRVLVSLLESNRGDLAGHSVQTAHFAERMCLRIGISEIDTAAATMAALLHDLGKGSPYHLTPFNVAEWDGHRTAAEKRFENPLRLFESAELPEATHQTLRHMYERHDGKGFPDGQAGKNVPLGARILAMSDTFSDLTANPRNPYRRTLDTEEAMKVLEKAKQTVFDPNLVDLFGVVVAGDDIKRQLLTGAHSILLVDSDPEHCAVLDLQLMTRGFKVRTTRSADLALAALSESLPSLIVSEVDLEPFDGFALKERLNSKKETQSIPFLYFSSRTASADVEKGFALGAQDYLVKPSSTDIVIAKIKKYLDEKPGKVAGGVSGSLKEMSLPDLVQILSHGRKNGQLKLTIGQHQGEIHFVGGEIYNAMLDNLRGEEAFFQMLRFRDGTFVLNPNFKAESRAIEMTAEMLLLEGMRRFDEDNR